VSGNEKFRILLGIEVGYANVDKDNSWELTNVSDKSLAFDDNMANIKERNPNVPAFNKNEMQTKKEIILVDNENAQINVAGRDKYASQLTLEDINMIVPDSFNHSSS
jgi:hypothetical protein